MKKVVSLDLQRNMGELQTTSRRAKFALNTARVHLMEVSIALDRYNATVDELSKAEVTSDLMKTEVTTIDTKLVWLFYSACFTLGLLLGYFL